MKIRRCAPKRQNILETIALGVGPGGDGFYFGALYARLWRLIDRNNLSAQATGLRRMADQYDQIGFSPRGVGSSTRLHCVLTTPQKAVNDYNDSEANLDAILYNARLEAEACLDEPLTPYINTEFTVQDMDLIRHLLGDEKLNYIGYSYGTWLGAWYASRFPERAGRMLLDSNVDFSATINERYLAHAGGDQRLFDEILAPYAADRSSDFGLPASAEEIGKNIPNRFDEKIKNIVLPNVYAWLLYNGDESKLNPFLWLRAGQVVNDYRTAHPDAPKADYLAHLEAFPFVDENAENNDKAKENAQSIVNELFKETPVFKYELFGGTHYAVNFSDTRMNSDEQFWKQQAKHDLASHLLRGAAILDNAGIYWRGPYAERPPLANADKADTGLMLLQSHYDPRTPIEGALNAFSQLNKAKMLLIEKEYHHGIFPYETDCVDLQVANYFNDGKLPDARIVTCEGKDETIKPYVKTPFTPPAGMSAKSAQETRPAPKQSEPSIYTNPEEARKIIKEIKSRIR